MKVYIYTAVFCHCLAVAAFCRAADVAPMPLDCITLQSSAIIKRQQRIEIPAQGFSILPPQGERWCYRLLYSYGVSFFKIPPFAGPLERPTSLEEFVATRVFSAMAMSLKGLVRDEGDSQNPDELKTLVDLLIREHLFSQSIAGVSSVEHRFRLLASNVATQSYSGANCVSYSTRESKNDVMSKRPISFLCSIFPATSYVGIPPCLNPDLSGSVSLSDTFRASSRCRTL